MMTIIVNSFGMNRDQILASRENDRISDFLIKMVSQGRMTEFERQIVRQEGVEILIQAGQLDMDGTHQWVGDENRAITKQANHREREKIKELHPELVEELNSFIEHRPHHPLPPVTSQPTKRGSALQQYETLLKFIAVKRKTGEIKHEEAHAMYEPAIRVFEDSGVFMGDLTENTEKSVIIKAHDLVKAKLVQIHPEMGNELRTFMGGRML